MNTRITLTAVALGMMTLAGCSTMGEDKMMAKPAAKAAPAPAPVVETVPLESGEVMVKDAMKKEAMATGETMAKEVMVEETMVKEVMVEEVMVKETMVEGDAMMAKEEMSAGDAAFNACFANGGQVVNFIGDPTGETMACENDGVQTILVL